MHSIIVGLFTIIFCSISLPAQGQMIFGWAPQTINLIEGGPPKTAIFGSLNGAWEKGLIGITCLAKTPNIPASVLYLRKPGMTKPLPGPVKGFLATNFKIRKINVSFKAMKDGICKDKQYKISVTCNKIFPKQKPVPFTPKFPVLTVNVKNTEQGSICEDPHLTQKVNGVDEDGKSVRKNICYDLFGKSGDQIELINDQLLGTSIVFELRDDYYIGKIFYSTKIGYFNFTSTQISNIKKKDSTWGEVDKYIVGKKDSYPHAIIEQSSGDVLIEYIDMERSQTIRIVKVQQSYGKSYLNVLVEKSTNDNGVFDKYHGGIFGIIANQNYEFYDPVQDDMKMTVVKINGRFVKAFLKGEPEDTDRCYSMSLEDLIYPNNVYSFQKSL